MASLSPKFAIAALLFLHSTTFMITVFGAEALNVMFLSVSQQ